MTKEQELAMRKIQVATQTSCLRITPYMEFSNGTKGSVLLVDYVSDEFYLLLFDSPERKEENENSLYGYILMTEAERYVKFCDECLKRGDDEYCLSEEAYEEYGVALLAGRYVGAYVADLYCKYLNDHNEYRYWRTSRTSNLIDYAISNYKMPALEDDLDYYMSAESTWRRTILSETILLFSGFKSYMKEMRANIRESRNVYVDWLSRAEISFKLYFAQQVILAYHDKQERFDWRKLLEDASLAQREKKYSFRYSDYNIQEIIGFYALSKYLYTERPDYFEKPQYSETTLEERVPIFKEYMDMCAVEMLEEMRKKNDPLRITLPTIEEARAEAKKHMIELIGRQPEGLPDEVKVTYSKYEEGFCRNVMKISYVNPYTYNPRKPLDGQQPQVLPESTTYLNTDYRSKEQIHIPNKRDYNAVREYIEERKRVDEAFKEFCNTHSRPDLCEVLTKEFGWFVNPHSLGANINRHI